MQTRSSDQHCFYFLGWSSKQGAEVVAIVEPTVRYHKADVIYHGKVLMASKRCGTWRPEANLRFDGDIMATCYFGMGAQESTGLTDNFVFFTRRLSILRAVVQVVENIGGVDRYRGDVDHKAIERAQALAYSMEDSYAEAQSTASEVLQPDAVSEEDRPRRFEDDVEFDRWSPDE